MGFFGYRKPSLKNVLGITKAKKELKKALGITAATKPLRAETNLKRRVKRAIGLESTTAKVMRNGLPRFQPLGGLFSILSGLFSSRPAVAPSSSDEVDSLMDDWERLYLSDCGFGVADLSEQHVLRTAEILSERFPDFIFMWDDPHEGKATISAIKATRRRVADSTEGKIVAAGEAIAESIAAKYPILSARELRRNRVAPLKRGLIRAAGKTSSR